MQGLCDVTPEGYHHLTKLLMNLANGKVVVALEVKQFTTLQYFFYGLCVSIHNRK